MKVREAIEKLQQMDPEAELTTHGSDHTFVPVFRFEATQAEDVGELVESYDGVPMHGGEIVPVVAIAE